VAPQLAQSQDPTQSGQYPALNDPNYFLGAAGGEGTQNGGGTVQLGINIAGKVFGLDGTLTLGVALDGGGNLAGYAEYGAGAATSPDLAIGVVGHASNAATVQDLAGPFVNVNSGGGWGPHATGDGFTSTSSPIVMGGGFTVGTGAGAASSVTYTNTVVTPSVNAVGSFLNWVCTWAICGF
jgi:hypothetical protein